MQLTVWTYEGPPHVGAMRIATAMEGVHYVLHAPQGDTYADLLFTMIERRNKRPPVTYTTFQARDLGSDTANLFKTAVSDAYARFSPQAMLVGASCTAELIQDDPGGLARGLVLAEEGSRAPWYSKSVDSTYLTGKRVFVFGDATHAVAAARIATQELGFTVVGLGSYSREFAREVREAAKLYNVEPLITEDYLEVEAKVAELQPELVPDTQMERHIAKRQGVACAVISAPVHVQDFPARYSPQMGFEGANVIFDTWVHPLMMGLEEHLLTMFREDPEFHDGMQASHLGAHSGAAARREPAAAAPATAPAAAAVIDAIEWSPEAQKELGKIPFFVRGKARRNTERFATETGVATITLETLYDAKAHFGR